MSGCELRWIKAVLAGWFALGWLVIEGAAATPNQATLAIYEPFRVEAAALAPDGRHVAFALRDGRKIAVYIHDTSEPGRKVRLTFEDRSTARVAFFEWADADRLIVMSDAPHVISTDAKGVNVFTLLDARNFVTKDLPQPASLRVLGIPPEDRGGLMLETTVAAAEPGDVRLSLVRLDLATGERRLIHAKEMTAGGSFILDQQGRPRVLLMRGDSPQRFYHLAERGGPHDWKAMDRQWPGVGAGFFISAQNFAGRRAIPLGFDHDPQTLYFASNAGRDTFGVYALDLRTGGKVRAIAEDDRIDLVNPAAPPGSGLVFDLARQTLAGVRAHGNEGTTRWVDAQIGETQAAVEAQFPGRRVSLLGWDAGRARFMVLVDGDDAGRYFVFHRADARCVEYFRRAKIDADDANRSEPLTVELAAGERLAGTVVWPRHPPIAKPGLVIWFHDGPWQQAAPGFSRDVEALATMGFVVAQFDYHGSAGYGLKHREAMRGAFDRVPVADALAVVEAVAAGQTIDQRRIAVGGEGFGGYLALRALQLHPEVFRCGVAIDAPLELEQLRESSRDAERRRSDMLDDMARSRPASNPGASDPAPDDALVDDLRMQIAARLPTPVDFEHQVARAYFGSGAQLAKFSVVADAARLTRPVLFLHDPANEDISIRPVQSLAATLARRKQAAEVVPLSPQFALGQPAARAAAFRRIGEFLNANLYDFKVEIGEVKEKEEGR